MNRQDAALRATVAKVLGAMVTEQSQPARSALVDAMIADGVEKQRVRIGDQVLGVTSLVTPGSSARVVDEPAFLAWVAAHHPTEVQTVTIVRPAFRTHLLDRVEDADGEPVDPLSGEVVPGVEVVAGRPYTRISPVKGAARIVVEAIRSGAVDPLALPAGDSEVPA